MSGSPRFFLVAGCLSAALGVAAGAFGAHGLEGSVTPERLAAFETAVQYHVYHAFALLVTGLLMARHARADLLARAGWLFLAGTVLFAGSLYLLVLSDTPILGAITPPGGVAFIAGWIVLAWAVSRPT